MDVRLRPATDHDKEFARRVHHDAYRDVVQRQFGRFGDEQDVFFDKTWNGGGHAIVEVDGERAGYTKIIDDDDAIKVQEIVIGPDFQNRGIGTRVLNDVLERARSSGNPVRLGVLHENHDARRLYERLGFRAFDTDATHTLMEWRKTTS